MPLRDPELLRRQEYAEGFWFLMVGFALVFFDFRFGDLDVLPDALGHAIAAYGAAYLRPLHAWATHAYTMAIGLAVVAGFRLLGELRGVNYAATTPGRAIEFVETACAAAVLWVLFQIVIDLAERLNAGSLAGEAHTHRLFLAALILGTAALGAFMGAAEITFTGEGPAILALASFLLFGLVLVLVLRVFLQASNLCRYGRLWPPRGTSSWLRLR